MSQKNNTRKKRKATRLHICFKSSGNTNGLPEFHKLAIETAKNHHVVVYVGGGCLINDAFKKAGYPIRFGPLGRITSKKGRELATQVLQNEKEKLDKIFFGTGIIVELPILYSGGRPIHINNDRIVRTFYRGYNKFYIVTKKERVAKKEKLFKGLNKVEIIGL
jgi:hypothetical protein